MRCTAGEDRGTMVVLRLISKAFALSKAQRKPVDDLLKDDGGRGHPAKGSYFN